jgi:hypothetical protein
VSHGKANPAGHDEEDGFLDLWTLLAVFDSSFHSPDVVDNCSARPNLADLDVKALGAVVFIALIVVGDSGHVIADLVTDPVKGKVLDESLKPAIFGRDAFTAYAKDLSLLGMKLEVVLALAFH